MASIDLSYLPTFRQPVLFFFPVYVEGNVRLHLGVQRHFYSFHATLLSSLRTRATMRALRITPPRCLQLVTVDIGLYSVTFTYHDIGKLYVTIVGNLNAFICYVRVEKQIIILGNCVGLMSIIRCYCFPRFYNDIHFSTLCASVSRTNCFPAEIVASLEASHICPLSPIHAFPLNMITDEYHVSLVKAFERYIYLVYS